MASTTPRRRSNRLAGFNYREPGMYFVTPCTFLHQTRFGAVREGTMHLNRAGQMVSTVWQELPLTFPRATLNSWVVMPNHKHGLIQDIETNPALGDLMKWFKAITTNRYIHGVRDHGWPRFNGHTWQRNYYDHIVRNDADLSGIRLYIDNNPATWEVDQLYRVEGGDPWDPVGEVQGQHGG